MKVCVVYDRVNKFGGAERFLQSILKVFPSAPIYTLVHEPKTSTWAAGHKVIPTFLNKIPFLRVRHEILAPIAPLAFETLDLSEYDLIISVTSSDGKAVITHPNQVHICYCLTPTRYLWSLFSLYKKDIKLKFLPRFVLNYFRFVDKVLSHRPDHYLAISNEVKRRIKKYYERSSTVIYPPVSEDFFVTKPVSKKGRGYFLVAGRLVPYKKTDLVIETFNKLNEKLIVVGTGSELKKLKKMAGKNISFITNANDKKLKHYYSHAKALISPQLEDFGLIPLEAQSAGTPVISYKKGGALETVIDGKTGVFFNRQTPDSLLLAIKKFQKTKIDYQNCIKNAKRFNQKQFSKNLKDYINKIKIGSKTALKLS